MAATGKTPILLYGSTTASNVPVAGNLTNSSDGCEIAINVADKNLFFKDSGNVVNTVPIRQSSGSSDGWLSSTDWTTFNNKQPAGSYALTTGTLAQFASTTSAQLAGVISDETGSGSLVFGTSPTFTTTVTVNGSFNAGGAGSSTAVIASGSYGGGLSCKDGTVSSGFFAESSGTNFVCFVGQGSSDTASSKRVMEFGTSDVKLNKGNLVIGTSGKGIDFSATAGTGTSELLADYEEGTFTPVIYGTTSAGTGTYATNGQVGTYTKIGNRVLFNIWLSWTNHTGTGNIRISGLPYTSNSSASNFAFLSCYNDGLTLAANSYLMAYVGNNATIVTPQQVTTGGGTSGNIGMDTAATIGISGQYYV